MVDDFRKFCEQHQLLITKSPILLTVSGGIDSVVLVDLFQKAGFQYAIAHCNFQLRGEDAKGDEEFVKKLAQKNGVKFYAKRFNTLDFAQKNGISTQMAARELRYNWFREICKENNITYFATAHHLNDSLETILLNLSKGTGFLGLKGITIKTEDTIRPLLFTKRDQIVKYAAENKITWREDSSNLSTKYQRNLLRHKVIPVLTEINPNLLDTFSDTQERLHDTVDFLQEWILEYKSKYLKEENTEIILAITSLKKHAGSKALLYELIKPYGFNYVQTKLINGNTENGKVFYSNTHTLSYYHDQLIITPKDKPNITSILINEADNTVAISNKHLQINKIVDWKMPNSFDNNTAYIDLEQLKFPLTVRQWQQGDYFHPIGMEGKKKLVSDLLNDLKIPVNNKSKILVLCSNNKIVWIIGIRVDNRFKGIPNKSVLRFTIEE